MDINVVKIQGLEMKEEDKIWAYKGEKKNHRQNWKAILKNALGITFGVVAFYVVGMAGLYGIIALISGGAGDGWAILFLIIAFFLIDVIKVAFVDTYVTISVVNKYLPLTMNQQPALDIYEKGQKWSKKFKDMCNKAKEEPQPVVQAAVAGVPGMTMAMPTGEVQQPVQPQVVMQQPGMSVGQPMPQQPMMGQQPQLMPQQPMMAQPQVAPVGQPMQQQMPQQPMMQQEMAPQQPMMQQPQMMPQQPMMGQPAPQQMQQPMPGQFPNNNGQM